MCRPTILLVLAALAAGCSDRDPAAMQYATTHASSLVTTTRTLWTKHRERGPIPEAEYTPEIRALQPDLVVSGEGGLTLFIKRSPAHMAGIFIRHVPSFPTPAKVAPDSEETTYLRLADDVYWFSRPR